MQPFNNFQPILDDAYKFGRRKQYHILGMKNGKTDFLPIYKWQNGSRELIEFTSPLDRKKESQQKTVTSILVFDDDNYSMEWKCTYKNKKGIYVKKQGVRYYITEIFD